MGRVRPNVPTFCAENTSETFRVCVINAERTIFYRNWLNFTKFKKGRVSTIIFINDIQHITYKGSGWFAGVLLFTFKHTNKPIGIHFSKWFVSRSKKLNTKMTPIYEYIRGRVISNNKYTRSPTRRVCGGCLFCCRKRGCGGKQKIF